MGRERGRGHVDADILEIGDCVADAVVGGSVGAVPLVPCHEPHRYEIYARVEVDVERFPGGAELDRRAEDECLARFAGYVGIHYERAGIASIQIRPTRSSWDLGDRTILCLAELPVTMQRPLDHVDVERELLPRDVSVHALDDGDCLSPFSDLTSPRATLVPCREPHGFEVLADLEVTERTFPGDGWLTRHAESRCREEFEDHTVEDDPNSRLGYTYLVPSERSWREANDRSITCLLVIGEPSAPLRT